MSFFSFVVVPPALYFLRKMIRRISNIAKRQFTGGARILETMQETIQGIRIVKAFTLEDTMRARLTATSPTSNRSRTRWARTAHRAGPLMEAMGGFAIAFAMIYGGYRVLETGATPGPVLLVPDGVPAGLRAGQAARAAQHRSQHRAGRSAHPVRDPRPPADRTPTTTTMPLKLIDRPRRIRRRAVLLPTRARACSTT